MADEALTRALAEAQLTISRALRTMEGGQTASSESLPRGINPVADQNIACDSGCFASDPASQASLPVLRAKRLAEVTKVIKGSVTVEQLLPRPKDMITDQNIACDSGCFASDVASRAPEGST